ncbi:MAG: GspH/FimT family pseudopilin [Patescibacteria group bacterium]
MNDKIFNSQIGFSLLQLLAVIGIIVIMSAIAIPTLRHYEPSIKLKAESRQLASDLRYAQQLTVTEQKIYYLEIDLIGRRYLLVKQETPASPLKTVSLTEGISWQTVSGFDNNRIVFNSYGAVSQAGQIVLTNTQGDSYTINVKPSGYVQLTQ